MNLKRMGADADLIIVYRKDVREIERQLNNGDSTLKILKVMPKKDAEIVYVDGEQLIELVGEKTIGFSINY